MQVTKKGEALDVAGTQLRVGEAAPDFSLKNLQDKVVSLADFSGCPVLISVVPDINTKICSLQTQRFNKEAAQIETSKFLTISNNTKEDQATWCAAKGIDMEILHDTDNVFGQRYGLFIPTIQHLARAILIVNQEGTIVYQAISSEIAEEPDYTEALDKLKSLQ